MAVLYIFPTLYDKLVHWHSIQKATARVFRRDSPEKAAQWLAGSIRES
jgi:hypothetical protein